MALSTFVDTFTIPTSTAGTTITRTGYGFQPKAVMLWCSGRTESVDAVGGQSQQWCVGCATSPTVRVAQSMYSQDGAASAVAGNALTTNACLQTITTASATVDGLLDVQSFDSNGVTFIIDDAFATTLRVTVWALGGTDLTNAVAGTFSSLAGTGTQNVVLSPGFQPSIVFLLLSGQAVAGSARFGLGYGTDASHQATVGVSSRTSAANSETYRYSTATHILGLPNLTNTTNTFDAQLVSMQSDGFQLEWITNTVSRSVAYLALQGGQWTGFASATRTDTTPWSVSGLSFAPTGLLVASVGTTEHARGTATTNALLSLGAASSATNRSAQGCSEEDSVGTMEVATIVEHDALYARLDFADAIGGLMDIQSFDATGVTFVMDDPDPDAAFFWAVACGSAAAQVTRSLTANILSVTNTPTAIGALQRPLTATVGSATDTPTTLATLSRAMLSTVLSSTTTPDALVSTTRATTATVPGTTNTVDISGGVSTTWSLTATLVSNTSTLAALVSTARAYTATMLGTTSTPPISTEAPPSAISTLYLQDRSLSTLWALTITNGVMRWSGTSGTADPEPILLDQADLSTIWTLYIDGGVLRWEEAGTTPEQLLLLDTATPTLWDVQIYAGRITWVNATDVQPPYTHYTLQDRSTPLIWSLAIGNGQLTWTETSGDTQPDPVLLDRGDGTTLWTLYIDNGVLRWEVAGTTPALLLLDDTVTETIWDLRIRSGVLEWGPAQVWLASVPGRTTTPAASMQIAGAIQFSTTIAAVTDTPASVSQTSRALFAALPGSTQTPAITMQMAGMIQWLATVAAATTTPSVVSTTHRQLSAISPGTTSTPDAGSLTQRVFSAQVSASTQTPAITIQMAGMIQFTATVVGATATADSALTHQRMLLSVLPGQTNTPASASTLQRLLVATLSAPTNTVDVLQQIQRALLALVSGSTLTTDSMIQMAGLVQLSAAPDAQTATPGIVQTQQRRVLAAVAPATQTPDVTAQVAVRRQLTAVIPGASDTPAVDLRRRAFVANLLGSTNTPPAVSLLSRLLLSLLPGTTNTPAVDLRLRALLATLAGTTNTPGVFQQLIRGLLAHLPSTTTTPIDAVPRIRRSLLAALTASTSTPDALAVMQRRWTAIVSAQTNTPAAETRHHRALNSALAGTTQTSVSIIQMAGIVQLSADIQGQSNTPAALTTKRQEYGASVPASTQTPLAIMAVFRRFAGAPSSSTTTTDADRLLTSGLRAILTGSTTTPTALIATHRVLSAAVQGTTNTPATAARQHHALTATLPAQTQTSDGVETRQTRVLWATGSCLSQTSTIVPVTHRPMTATLPAATQTPSFFIFMTGQTLFFALVQADTQTSVPQGVLRLPLSAQCTGITVTSTPALEPGGYTPAIRPPPLIPGQGGFVLATRPSSAREEDGFAFAIRPAA
jgi:hypothetical protein